MQVENAMIIGNSHDSSKRDFLDYCAGCGGEIYYGESYRNMNGDYLHDETSCKAQYVDDCSLSGVAGEE